MGFNKRFVDSKNSINALQKGDLRGYYGKSDALFFEDNLSSKIYDLFKEGKSEKEILLTINQNMEENTDEMYQSNQSI